MSVEFELDAFGHASPWLVLEFESKFWAPLPFYALFLPKRLVTGGLLAKLLSMETQGLIEALGYAESPHFFPPQRFDEVPAHAQVFRRAAQRCSLQGVYLLRDEATGSSKATPIVYIAEADDQASADLIHKQVWNQSTVPFLVVRTHRGVRLYSGFAYQRSVDTEQPQAGVLETLVGFHEVSLRLAAFHADQIDNGGLWRTWGDKVQPEKRVDYRLLGNLEAIGQNLHSEGVPREVAHALIGKLVYLRYLRDRDIISDWRLKVWNIGVEQVFGRGIEVPALQKLVEKLDEWLNGEIFPLTLVGDSGLSRKQIKQTAEVFLGDDARTGQIHLDFQAYDFSQIPIETLSTIYEQFLAIEGNNRESGAFYTPVPLVNFMVAEMEDQKPLESGMRVLDPSCGSGAFLVQCYRHLVEKQMVKVGRMLRPAELRDILVRQIFGVDRDVDACRVAQMSLILTMLDYIDPPDLQSTPSFKLPHLHDRNIYQSDFFDEGTSWATGAGGNQYDWVIGNPPWVELSSKSEKDSPALEWLVENGAQYPVTKNQTAEIFAWEASRYADREGVLGLLLPAMTFFKQHGAFRKRFFSEMEALGVANFTNLRRDLFVKYIGGKKIKMEIPAASLFFRRRDYTSRYLDGNEDLIPVYSPMLINQEAVRPKSTKVRAKVWGLVLNASEIKFVDAKAVATGAMLPWKVAMWGSTRDQCLLKKIDRRFGSFKDWAEALKLSFGEGPQLRKKGAKEPVEPAGIVVGKKRLVSSRLRNVEGVHLLMDSFTERVTESEGFVREGRKELPLAVCRPPHVIVSAARTFAFYTEDYLVVRPRQIGIAGSPSQSPLLKVLAIYLSSDFASYFEFFHAPQKGVARGGLSTLGTLGKLPVPLVGLGDGQVKEWCDLHGELEEASRKQLGTSSPTLAEGKTEELIALEDELNRKVNTALGLSHRERWLVHDLVNIRVSLTDGNLGESAVRKPSQGHLIGYGEMLRDELDSFLDPGDDLVHRVEIYDGEDEGFVSVSLVSRRGDTPVPIDIRKGRDPVTREMERLQREHLDITRQWIYFDRNLFVYDRDKTLIFKPQQRIWWTHSQAMNDADEIISAALAPEGPSV